MASGVLAWCPEERYSIPGGKKQKAGNKMAEAQI
jgi:hypothetical protein